MERMQYSSQKNALEDAVDQIRFFKKKTGIFKEIIRYFLRDNQIFFKPCGVNGGIQAWDAR